MIERVLAVDHQGNPKGLGVAGRWWSRQINSPDQKSSALCSEALWFHANSRNTLHGFRGVLPTVNLVSPDGTEDAEEEEVVGKAEEASQ